MEHTISRLLKSYENGALTRRQLIRGLVTVAVASTPAAAAAAGGQSNSLGLSGLHHVQINSDDVPRSTEFYQNVLGLSLLRVGPPNDPECCPDESAFFGISGGGGDPSNVALAIRRKAPFGVVDHISFSVTDFDVESVTRELTARGATPHMEATTGFYVEDPDGVKVQLL